MDGLFNRRMLALVLGGGVAAGCGPGSAPIVEGTTGSSSGTSRTTGSTTRPTTSVDSTADVPTSGGSSGSSGSVLDTTVGSTGSSGPGTSSSDTNPASTDSSGSDSGSSGSGSSGSGSSEGGSSSSGGGMPFMCPPGGGMACVAPGDCASGNCYVIGALGGVCSECDEDADCAWGCSAGNPLTGDCALCCDGSLGCGCETGLACQGGLSCTQLLSVPGIVDISTCSECDSDLDCAGGDLCAPSYDLSSFSGQHECVLPGSLPNGDGCDLAGSGNQQCASGNCAVAALMGIPVAGFCSVCNENADCGAGGICQLPEIAINGVLIDVVPGMCI